MGRQEENGDRGRGRGGWVGSQRWSKPGGRKVRGGRVVGSQRWVKPSTGTQKNSVMHSVGDIDSHNPQSRSRW